MLIESMRPRSCAAASRPSTPTLLAAAISFTLASAAATAQAQSKQPPQSMPKVSVQAETEATYKVDKASSPKFTQPLLDTPQTITVVNKELLQDQGAATLSEALRNTPGITFTLGENGNTTTGDSVFMRGFDTSGSIFLDGIRDLGTVTRDVFNVEQVEIVKGPSGSDNGRGTPTGYINMSSKAPQLQDSGFSVLTVGTDNRRRVTTDLNQAFEGGLPGTAVRFNAMYDEGDKPGRDIARDERWGLAPSLALGLGTSTRAVFNYLYIKQDNVPDGGIPALGLPGYSAATTTGNPPVAVAPASVSALNAAARVNSANFYGSTNDFDHVEANMFTVKLEHDFSGSTTLRNTLRYGRLDQDYVLTGVNVITASTPANPASWTVTRSRQGKNQLNEVLTNQTNLTTAFNTGSIGHSLSAGVEFIHERQANRTLAAFGTTDPANLYAPSTTDIFAEVLTTGASTDGRTTTGAMYVFDNIKLNEQWALNAGLRLERYETEYTSIAAPATPPVASTFLEGSDNMLTGKAALVYKPMTNGTLYAAYATSQQPPGSTNFALNATTTNINNPNLDPQKATNIEVGTKWELFDNQLVLTAAAFDTRNKNDQAIADTVTGEVNQYGEKKVRGIELGASGMITENWQVTAGIAKLDTEVSEPAVTQPTQQGASINFSPELTFTSWTTYRLPFGLTIGGGARFVDSQMTSVNNNPASVTNLQKISSYWVFDVMAGYEVNDRIGLQLNALNVTDEFYLASVNNGRSRYTLGAPRSAQLSVNVKF